MVKHEKVPKYYENDCLYLTLFGSENYDAISDRIRYFMKLKSDITYIFSHYFAKITVDSSISLPVEKYWLCIIL